MTEIDIANRALAKIHASVSLSSSTGFLYGAGTSLEATIVRQFYNSSRQQMFRIAPWTCIKTRKRLASEKWLDVWNWIEGELVVGHNNDGYAVYECTTKGLGGALEPTWPTSGTVSDGEAVWTFRYPVKADVPNGINSGFSHTFPLPADYINQVEFVDSNGNNIVAEIEGEYVFSSGTDLTLIYIPDQTDPNKWDALLQEAIVTQLASAIAFPITGDHKAEAVLAQSASALVYQAIVKTSRERRQGRKTSRAWFPGLFDRGQP